MTSQEDKLSDMNSGSELGWDYSGASYSLCIAPHCATVLEWRMTVRKEPQLTPVKRCLSLLSSRSQKM